MVVRGRRRTSCSGFVFSRFCFDFLLSLVLSLSRESSPSSSPSAHSSLQITLVTLSMFSLSRTAAPLLTRATTLRALSTSAALRAPPPPPPPPPPQPTTITSATPPSHLPNASSPISTILEQDPTPIPPPPPPPAPEPVPAEPTPVARVRRPVGAFRGGCGAFPFPLPHPFRPVARDLTDPFSCAFGLLGSSGSSPARPSSELTVTCSCSTTTAKLRACCSCRSKNSRCRPRRYVCGRDERRALGPATQELPN